MVSVVVSGVYVVPFYLTNNTDFRILWTGSLPVFDSRTLWIIVEATQNQAPECGPRCQFPVAASWSRPLAVLLQLASIPNRPTTKHRAASRGRLANTLCKYSARYPRFHC